MNISYNKFGAPELNISQNISISHSKELAVVLLGNKKVGIDIEKITFYFLHIRCFYGRFFLALLLDHS